MEDWNITIFVLAYWHWVAIFILGMVVISYIVEHPRGSASPVEKATIIVGALLFSIFIALIKILDKLP